jgi:TonB family protein
MNLVLSPSMVRTTVLVTGLCLVCVIASAQSRSNPTSAIWIAITTLSPPVYPPIARQARIMGDVKVQLGIRRDGSVASAEVVSGPPMLQQAALESVRKSAFLCQGCTEEVTTYFLTFTFGFRHGGDQGDCNARRARPRKCLYLWKCGIWQEPPARPPVVGESPDRVVILPHSRASKRIDQPPSHDLPLLRFAIRRHLEYDYKSLTVGLGPE